MVVNQGSGINWSISNSKIQMTGNWDYTLTVIGIKSSDSGTLDAKADDVSLSVSFTLGEDADGHPTIASTDCSCHIGLLTVEDYGHASWFYNILLKVFAGLIRLDVERLVCIEARHAIDLDADEALKTFQLQTVIEKNWLLDYRLVAAPAFGAGYVESFHKGEFFSVADKSEAPFSPSPVPSPAWTPRMMTIWLSDYVANTAGYALFEHGALEFNISKDDVPPEYRKLFDTTCPSSEICIGRLIPHLAIEYPNASVVLRAGAVAPPTVDVNATGAFGDLEGSGDYYVRLSDDRSPVYVFRTAVSIRAELEVSIDGQAIKVKAVSLRSNVTVVNSTIGPIPTFFTSVVVGILPKALIPLINRVGDKGFPLPNIKSVEYVNAMLVQEERNVCLMMDVKYTGKRR